MSQAIFQALGQMTDTLNELIQIHSALMQKEQEKEAKPNTSLPQAKVQTVGA